MLSSIALIYIRIISEEGTHRNQGTSDMTKQITIYIVICFLTSCGGEHQTIAQKDQGILPDTLYLFEGEHRFIEIDSNLNIKDLEIISEIPPFYQLIDDSVFIVAPNVDENTTLDLTFQISLANGTMREEDTKLEIKMVDESIPSTLPRPYPFASTLGKYEEVQLDSEGVPLSIYNGQQTYLPAYIAAYAYDHYRDFYFHQKAESKEKFLTVARWLKNNCVYTPHGFCSFRYFIQNDYYEVYDDWTSAMAQGQALTSLVAASILTEDKSFLDVAYDALSAFNYLARDKGVSSFRDELIWYEEYASEDMNSGVLNGFLFAMAGIHHFSNTFPGNTLATQLVANGMSVLESELFKFDMQFTSHYNVNFNSDKPNQIASAMGSAFDAYHELHIYQLAWLADKGLSAVVESFFRKFLQYDFGGLKLGQLTGSSFRKKILSIVGSNPVDPEKYGFANLTDENWTYGRYWSSRASSANLDVTLNEDVLETDVLNKLVLVFLDESQVPNTIEISSLDDSLNPTEPQIYSLASDEIVSTQIFQVSNYRSVVKTITLDYPVVTNKIRVNFSNSGIIALREINFLYERRSLESALKDILGD
jgi:hypothetical protein